MTIYQKAQLIAQITEILCTLDGLACSPNLEEAQKAEAHAAATMARQARNALLDTIGEPLPPIQLPSSDAVPSENPTAGQKDEVH